MFLPLGGFGQEEFWKESLDPSQVEVHFCKLFPLRLGIDRAPVFIVLRHLLSNMRARRFIHRSNEHASETDAVEFAVKIGG